MRNIASTFIVGLLALGLCAGCNQSQHPSVKDNVNASLKANNLGDLSVAEDRDKGVVTLTGRNDGRSKDAGGESGSQCGARLRCGQ